MNSVVNNNKYKTALCRHWKQSGQCSLGDKCHFAHGLEDIRDQNGSPTVPGRGPRMNNNTRPNQPYVQRGSPSTNSNYKTVKCRFYEKGKPKGDCKFGSACSFAHGDEDLRSSNSSGFRHSGPRPQQKMMPSMYDQSVMQNQMLQQQAEYLISELERHPTQDQEAFGKLKQAREYNNAGDGQNALLLVYDYMNRPEKSPEEQNYYAMLAQNLQTYGSYWYQNMQMPYSQSGMYNYGSQAMQPTMGMPQYMNGTGTHSTHNYNYKSNHYSKGKNQHNENYNTEDNHEHMGQGNEHIESMGGITNMMGGLHMQNSHAGIDGISQK